MLNERIGCRFQAMRTSIEAFPSGHKARHALDLMVRVAHARPGLPVTALRLSQGLGLSLSQVEALLRCVREAGLVRAYKGPGGGYCLERSRTSITVLDVVLAVQAVQPLAAAQEPCSREVWLTRQLDQVMQRVLEDRLAQTTLADLAPPEGLDDPAQQPLEGLHGGAFRLGPMPARLMPQAPNSVFDLSAFMARSTPLRSTPA